MAEQATFTCPDCNGRGTIFVTVNCQSEERTCPTCHGTGTVNSKPE